MYNYYKMTKDKRGFSEEINIHTKQNYVLILIMYPVLSKEATHIYINENHSELILYTDYMNRKINL